MSNLVGFVFVPGAGYLAKTTSDDLVFVRLSTTGEYNETRQMDVDFEKWTPEISPNGYADEYAFDAAGTVWRYTFGMYGMSLNKEVGKVSACIMKNGYVDSESDESLSETIERYAFTI